MKNVHLIATDKPSRLFAILQFNYIFDNQNKYSEEYKKLHGYKNKHIYITSNGQIKEGDWVYHPDVSQEYTKVNLLKEGDERYTKGQHVAQGVYKHKPTTNEWYKKERKIILTTDKSLEGVQAIDDEFLEWFIKNPSCEEVEVVDDLKYFNVDELRERHIKVLPYLYSERIGYKIIITKEEPKQETNLKKHLDSCEEYQGPRRSAIVDKQETIEEVALRLYPEEWDWKEREIFIDGAKWMQERSYSEEDMTEYAIYIVFNNLITPKQWLEQFKNKQNCLQIK